MMFNFYTKKHDPAPSVGTIPYGSSKKDGSHDHRSNRSLDRTPAQRAGDLKRTRKNSGK